jgi:molybdenum cofactor guanylyltransferase
LNADVPLGIVLAGGTGERLAAGKPKALVELAGTTLLARAVATLEALCLPVVVAAPADLALPGCPVPRVADAAGGGPLAGLAGAWRAVPGRTSIVLGVDFPLVRVAALRALLDRLGEVEAVIPEPGGRPQPLVAVYAAAAMARMAALFDQGIRAVTRASADLHALRVGDADLALIEGGLENFMNVNTAADLLEAARRLG